MRGRGSSIPGKSDIRKKLTFLLKREGLSRTDVNERVRAYLREVAMPALRRGKEAPFPPDDAWLADARTRIKPPGKIRREGPHRRGEAPEIAEAPAEGSLAYVLHVGITKTGSTSIQQFLSKNLEALSALGAYYPVGYLDRSSRQHSRLLTDLRKGHQSEVAAFLAAESGAAEAAGAHRLILSGEGLCNMTVEQQKLLRNAMAEQGRMGSAKVVIYYRNFGDRWVSRLAQRLKQSNEPVEAGELLAKMERAPSPSAQVAAFETVFGADAVDVRMFESALKTGLEQDFCQAAGIDWSEDFVIPPRVNASPDLITARLLNLLRSEFGNLPYAARVAELSSACYRLPALTNHFLEQARPLIETIDLSHPKLEPHREMLTAIRLREPASGPSEDQFLTDLIRTIQAMRLLLRNPEIVSRAVGASDIEALKSAIDRELGETENL